MKSNRVCAFAVACLGIAALSAQITGPVRVGPAILRGNAVFAPLPLYPTELIRPAKTGSVTLAVTVDTDGKVSSASVVEATDPLFGSVVFCTVRQWRFVPITTFDGVQPLRVESTFVFYFVFNDGKPEVIDVAGEKAKLQPRQP